MFLAIEPLVSGNSSLRGFYFVSEKDQKFFRFDCPAEVCVDFLEFFVDEVDLGFRSQLRAGVVDHLSNYNPAFA